MIEFLPGEKNQRIFFRERSRDDRCVDVAHKHYLRLDEINTHHSNPHVTLNGQKHSYFPQLILLWIFSSLWSCVQHSYPPTHQIDHGHENCTTATGTHSHRDGIVAHDLDEVGHRCQSARQTHRWKVPHWVCDCSGQSGSGDGIHWGVRCFVHGGGMCI